MSGKPGEVLKIHFPDYCLYLKDGNYFQISSFETSSGWLKYTRPNGNIEIIPSEQVDRIQEY